MIAAFFVSASLLVADVLLFAAMVGARELGALAHRVVDRRHGSSTATEGNANVLLSIPRGLLSLPIGFAFSLSLSRYDHRREVVASEASALTKPAQRIELLDAPCATRSPARLPFPQLCAGDDVGNCRSLGPGALVLLASW